MRDKVGSRWLKRQGDRMHTNSYGLIFKVYFAPTLTLFFLALNVGCGHIFMPNALTTPEQYRFLGGALALPLISGLCVFFLPILTRKAQSSIIRSARLSASSMRHARVYAHQVSQVPLLSARLAFFAGSILAITYLAWEGLLYSSSLGMLDNLRILPLTLQAVYFWIALVLFLLSLVRITLLLTQFATRDLRIELFHVDELVPLADSVLWNVLAVSAGVAMAPIFWLGRPIPALDIILVMTVMLVIMYLLLFPILRVKRIVSAKKELALRRVSDALKSATRSEDETKRRLTDSSKRMEDINNLVGVRRELKETKEWPITLPVGTRLVLLVLTPLASMVGAALVEQMVQEIIFGWQ